MTFNMVEEESKVLEIVESGTFERELKKKIYSQSYYEFFKVAYSILLPGTPYSDNWHIKYLCDRLQKEVFRIIDRKARKKDIIINIPFRSAKSLIVTQCFNAWAWGQDPTLKFICTSYSGALALEHATYCRNIVYSNWYQELYGDKVKLASDQNATGHYALEAGGFRKSVGMGGQITGSGADIIIIDDPQNPKMSASEVERKNVLEFYNHTLYSRLNQPELGVRIIVMQRLHEEDLSGHLIETSLDTHEHICMPVEIDLNKLEKENLTPKELIKHYDANGLFWTDRFSKKVINDFTKRLGSREAAGQLYQRPSPKEGNLVKSGWFDIVPPESVERDLQLNPIKFVLDTAESEEQKEKNDQTAIICGFKKNNKLYICNVIKFRKEFHETCKFIPEWVRMNRYSQYSTIKVEPKSSGKSVVSSLRNTTQLNISELPAPKDDKVQRMNSITPLLESRRVVLLDGAYLNDFMSSLTVFPNGKHDDDVDAFVHFVESELGTADFDFAFI